jgi:hypothetical protein
MICFPGSSGVKTKFRELSGPAAISIDSCLPFGLVS